MNNLILILVLNEIIIIIITLAYFKFVYVKSTARFKKKIRAGKMNMADICMFIQFRNV